jgi:hypothetical protein
VWILLILQGESKKLEVNEMPGVAVWISKDRVQNRSLRLKREITSRKERSLTKPSLSAT